MSPSFESGAASCAQGDDTDDGKHAADNDYDEQQQRRHGDDVTAGLSSPMSRSHWTRPFIHVRPRPGAANRTVKTCFAAV